MDLRISERKSGNVTILDLRGRVVIGKPATIRWRPNCASSPGTRRATF